jgi:hypothetical protein
LQQLAIKSTIETNHIVTVQGGKIFGSSIVKEVELDKWQEAIGDSEKEASNGKYLIKCV